MPDRFDPVPPTSPDPGGDAFALLREQVEGQAAQLALQARRLEAIERDHAATALRLQTTGQWVQGGLCQHLTNVMLSVGMLRGRMGETHEHANLIERIEGYARKALADTRALVEALAT